jgi:tetratricopeptide (TPR) repeat protein
VAAQAALTAATNTYNNAQGSAARKTALGQRDAALAALLGTLTAEKAQVDALKAAATTPDDTFIAGQIAAGLGVVAQDMKIIRGGYEAMLATGKYPAADAPKLQNAVGVICYELKDFVCAATQLDAALKGGFKGDNTEVLLADSFIQQGQAQVGLERLMAGIKARTATGTPAPQDWYRRGLSAAYKAKLLDQAGNFANGLVEAYPTRDNWAGAISILRLVAKYDVQERLDLMRLMQRTGSFTDTPDYFEFIQAADPRRLPAEVISVINEGLAAKKVDANDISVKEALAQATERVNAERPTLGNLEKTASSPTATGNSIAATADALMSYGQSAKAEALYRLALQKGGADVQRVNTRIGITLFDQGKYAEAKAMFDGVTGIRQPMTRLWSIYAAQKLAPKP